MEIPEITLKLETKIVQAKTRQIRLVRKNLVKRFPRKLKKKLKKEKGKQGFISWLNEPVKYVIGEPVMLINEDAERTLIKDIITKKIIF